MIKIKEKDNNAIKLANNFLRQGKVISLNCDTVYGVAADASNPEAIEKIYQLKERNKQKPIVIFVKDLNQAQNIFKFSEKSLEIAKKYFPSLTLILEKKKNISYPLAKNLNENDNFLGFRILDNKFIQKLLAEFNGILAVTSANPSNIDAAINADEVEEYFRHEDILIIDSGDAKEKIASSVIKIYNDEIEILRQGKTKIS